jgi:hypothetical protein
MTSPRSTASRFSNFTQPNPHQARSIAPKILKTRTKAALIQIKAALIQIKPALIQTQPALIQTQPALIQTQPALI